MSKPPRWKTPEEVAKIGKKIPKTLYLDANVVEYLDKQAIAAGTNLSKLVNQIIMEYASNLKASKSK